MSEPRFRWDKEERINSLIQCMLSYKSKVKFEGKKDFNVDKVKLYESVRLKMAKIYVHELPVTLLTQKNLLCSS